MVAKYVTYATPGNVLEFYRKPLSKYGEVLECDHGIAVGAVKVAKSGLTCADTQGKARRTRATRRALIASCEAERRSDTESSRSTAPRRSPTHFTLVLLEVPKDDDTH